MRTAEAATRITAEDAEGLVRLGKWRDYGAVPEADSAARRVRLIKNWDSFRSDPEEKLVARPTDRGRWLGYPVCLFFGGSAL